MNDNLRELIEAQFPHNQDRQNIIRLIEIANVSPRDVRKKADEIIDILEMEEDSNE